LGTSIIYSRWLSSQISDLTINGDLCYSSEGIVLDRVGSIGIHNVGFRGLQNHEIRAFGVNSLQIFGCEGGTLGRGLDMHAVADATIHGCFFDGPRGPALRFVGNLSRIADSVFEFSSNPRTSVPPMEYPTAVNTTTDEFTVTSSYGHKLHTGQALRFDRDTNSIPTNLTTTTDYYVVVTGDNTFKISTMYADEVSRLGAMYSNSFVDITDTGSGTWYVGSGPAVGISITGDHNSISGNQSQQNYEGALRVEGGNGNNAFTANQFIMNGLGNTDTNIAAVIVTGSPYNRFINNSVDDRDLGGFSQKGFVLDSDADYNAFIGNSWNIDTPYTFGDPAKQLVIDAKQSVYQWNGSYGNLYIPAAAGFTEWTPQVWTNSVPIQFDYTSGRLLLWDGDSWMHAVTAPYGSNTYWSANSGTLTAVNNGTAIPFLSFNGPYPGSGIYMQINDGSGATDASILSLYRNYGTNSSTFAALPAFTKFGEIQLGGWTGTSSGNAAAGARLTAWSDAIDWSSTNRGSQVNIDLVPNGTTTVTTALTFQAPLSPSTNDTMLLLSYWNGSSWVASAKRVSFGTNDSAGSGFKVLKVAN